VLLQVVIAGAFELPHGLAEGVEVKRVDGAVEGLLDFEFDFIGLNRFVAYGTELPGPAPAPHSFRGIVRQSSIRDALARDRPQFLFESGKRHDRRPVLLNRRLKLKDTLFKGGPRASVRAQASR
jgi:hypothetical protein